MKRFAVPLAVALVLSVTHALAFSPKRDASLGLLLLLLIPTFVLCTGTLLWARARGHLGLWLRPQWGDFSRAFFMAALLFFVVWGGVRLSAPRGSTQEVWLISLYAQLGDPIKLQQSSVLIAFAILVFSLGQEVLFRGLILHLSSEALGKERAFWFTAALYAFTFVPAAYVQRAGFGPINVLLVAFGCASALAWGTLARAYDRIAPSVLAHALFLWTITMVLPLWSPFHR